MDCSKFAAIMVVEANIPKSKCNCLSCELRNLVFTNLEEEDVRRICESKEEFSYVKGEIIHREGDPIHYFKYLRTGLVKLFKQTPEGDEQIITITRPFEFVSNTNVFHEDTYSYSLSALDDSVVCCVRIEFL